jgi:hypothetical protein
MPTPDGKITVLNPHYISGDASTGPETITAEIVGHDLASFGYGVSRQGPERLITYQCPSDHGPFLVDALKGVSNFSNPIFSLSNPHQYMDNTALRCMDARLSALVGPPRPAQFGQGATLAKITAEYGIIPWDPIGAEWEPLLGFPVPWTYVTMDVGREEHMATGDTIRSVTGKLVSASRVSLPVVTYTFRRTMIPDFVAYKTIAAGLVGKLNSGTWFGEAAETIRFETFGMAEEERDPSGSRVFTLTAQFKWRPINWNYGLCKGYVRRWERIQDLDGNAPYQTADFSPLLYYGLV